MKLLNFGSLNKDFVYDVEHFVEPGETMSSLGLFINCGGKGLNQSIAAAKAGCAVFHAGVIGADGGMLEDKLRENGVDVSYLQRADSPNGHAIIQVDSTGQNCILLYGGTNQLLTEEYIDRTLDVFAGEKDVLVLLQNETNLVGYIIKEAHKRGLKTALNAAPMNQKVFGYPLELLGWLIVNEVEGRQIAGCETDEEIFPLLREKYPHSGILLTLGSRGACCGYGAEEYQIGCHTVDVVDTTAAGDTFSGFFLSSFWEDGDIPKALRLASAASALAIGRKGASDSVPMRAEVEEAMQKGTLNRLDVKKLK